jgi:ABC-type lipoprotein release transport system permease subunit
MLRLSLRSLLYYWRPNAAVVAGVAIAVAVLAGALLVGQSVQASLRELLAERLGATDYVVSADRFFREALADDLGREEAARGRPVSCPLISLKGALRRDGGRKEAYDVNVYGVDERFWQFHGVEPPQGYTARAALVGAPLAAVLDANPGDALLLRIETGGTVPGETLYGRKGETSRTIRFDCGGIASAVQLGEFALRPSQATVYSVFVPLKRLQRELGQPAAANTILIAGVTPEDESDRLLKVLRERLAPADLGVRVRSTTIGSGAVAESSRVVIEEPIARAVFEATREERRPAAGVFAYLANAIRAAGTEVPYSVIAAADLGQGTLGNVRYVAGSPMPPPGTTGAEPSIWLNEWAWKDLGVGVGEQVEVDYYLWEDAKGLVTKTARFTLAGVVSIGGDVDATLAPEVPGVTDADTLRDWDPPFPVDLGRIRPQDEAYWDQYRGTPKAFVTLSTGQDLWRSRFGQLTAVRTALTPNALFSALAGRVDPGATGFTVAAVRQAGLEASRGAVDLGEYFLYFSAFLIAAAVMLAASFFRLGIEQRVREIGALRAVGFSVATLRRMFLAEGAVLLLIGSVLGVLGAWAYGGGLVAGLSSWWVGAVGTDRLSLHLSWREVGVGVLFGCLASFSAIVWTLRGVASHSPRALLAGMLDVRAVPSGATRLRWTGPTATLAAAALVLGGSAAGAISDVAGFFAAGALLLVSTLGIAARILRRVRPHPIGGHGWRALARLAFRGAALRPARSLLPVALIASATFVIVSVEAFRKDARDDGRDHRSGTGGFALVVNSTTPLIANPSSPEGLEALGLDAADLPGLAEVGFVPFRERAGDDASCLNLYAPREPRVIGAPAAFVADGRFSFATSLAATPEERRNPWVLLERALGDGVVPAIADANSLQYSLHLAVGDEITVPGSDGSPMRLRVVAALADSILQGVLIVSEENFLRLFPEHVGYRTFLINLPEASASSLAASLSERLAESGMRVEYTVDRLKSYHRVENTYLSTFQSLGALGLVLGTVGLLAVLLRNVLERRSELAMLRAMGYRQVVLSAMMVAEHVLLLFGGLACGTVSALVAIAPALATRGGTVPLAIVVLLLVAVSAVGLLASLAGGLAVLRAPLVPALRSE